MIAWIAAICASFAAGFISAALLGRYTAYEYVREEFEKIMEYGIRHERSYPGQWKLTDVEEIES